MQAANWLAVAVICLSTVLTAGLRFCRSSIEPFSRPLPPAHGDRHEHGEAPWPIVVALTVTAAATPCAAIRVAREIPYRLATFDVGTLTP